MATEFIETRRSPTYTSRVERKQQGAIELTATVTVALIIASLLVLGGVFLLFGVSIEFVKIWVAITLIICAIPWGVMMIRRLKCLMETLEVEIYRQTGYKLDLDLDGRTGDEEVAESDTRITEVIRPVPVNGRNSKRVIKHTDGRTLDAQMLRDFVIRSFVSGLSISYWKDQIGQKNWETARDILSSCGVASARQNGVEGQFLVSRSEALSLLGL